jgi:hypothetical protein
MQGTVEVTDLFKGAFLLCMGGWLDRVRVRNNGRRIATFLITGKIGVTLICDIAL